MNLDKIIVVDIETGGLDPDEHPVWEIAAARWRKDLWVIEQRFVRHDTRRIDPWVLANTGYADRYDAEAALAVEDAAAWFSTIAAGRHIVGMVPSFDEERLRRMPGALPSWHYHLIDVEAVLVGFLHAQQADVPLPWSSEDLSHAVGIDPAAFDRHTAAGDVRWSISLLAAIGLVPRLEP